MSKKEESKQDESYIVQNIAPGPLCISDLRLTFGAFEVMDLTYLKSEHIRSSRDLKSALMRGMLRRISEDQWESIEQKKIAKEQAELIRQNQHRKTQNLEVGDKTIEAEIVNLNSAAQERNAQNEVATAGNVNDALTYATAFANAQRQASDRGKELDPVEFYEMVNDNPNLLKRFITGERTTGTISGSAKGRATVITAPGEDGETGVSQFNMSNFNRDHHMAGAAEMDIFDGPVKDELDLSAPVAEEIDLAADEPMEGDPGSVHRK